MHDEGFFCTRKLNNSLSFLLMKLNNLLESEPGQNSGLDLGADNEN